MPLKLLNRNSIFRVDSEYFIENFCKHIEGLPTDRRIWSQFHFFNVETLGALGVDLVLHINAFEGKISKKNFKEKYSYCPDIDLIIIYLFFENLWGHIRSSSTESVHILVIFTAKP